MHPSRSAPARASIALAALMLQHCGGAPPVTPTDGAVATDAPAAAADAADDAAPLGDGDSGVSCVVAPPSEPGLVATDRGVVRGVREGDTFAYRGVPYAAPPVGALRWRAPEPFACFRDVRDATQFGPLCPQADSAGRPQGAEDCLTLNVWTPATASAAPLPVMFWIHGGGNTMGGSADRVGDTYQYDGRAISERGGVVVVTINYRLGALGFLAHPALSAEGGGRSGNYGILDQLAALRWVQRNARAFGGDPARVTVFGESAGGRDTCVLLASPLARGLFARAIIQSGGCAEQPLAQAEAQGATRVAATTCSSAADVPACLRALDANAVLRALPGESNGLADTANGFGANVDGYVLADTPAAVIRAGAHNHVPVILGTNADETSRLAPMLATAAEYEAAVRALYGARADAVLRVYPAAMYPTPRAAFVALTSDVRFICPIRRVARALRAAQPEPVRRYVLTRGVNAPLLRAAGAFHGLDVLYLFRSLAIGGYMPTAAEWAVADAFVGYWTRFGATGDPNGAGAAAWPAYDAARDNHVRLDDPVTSADGVRTAQCDALDALTP